MIVVTVEVIVIAGYAKCRATMLEHSSFGIEIVSRHVFYMFRNNSHIPFTTTLLN
jgi:predicted membrane chloride channel (bestrophin family)